MAVSINVTKNEICHDDFLKEVSNYDPVSVTSKLYENAQLATELRRIIGECEVHNKDLHPQANVDPNGDLTIFYRYFFTKYISNLQEQRANSGTIVKYASIFPFRVDPNLQISDIETPIAEKYDRQFLDEIRRFVENHLEHPTDDLENFIRLFLANIVIFRSRHFENIQYRRLMSVAQTGSNPSSWRNPAPGYVTSYLEHFPRLTDAGVEWYQNFAQTYNAIAAVFKKEKLLDKSNSYFRYLPEINCCQLLLLLESDFYSIDRENYVRWFEKYLFFFSHAIRVEPVNQHPIFFIDDTLFECLKSKKKYENFRADLPIFDILWDLWMMTAVHRRKHPLPEPRRGQKRGNHFDRENLENVMSYVENQISDLQSANVYYTEQEYPLRFKMCLVVDDAVYSIGYSRRTFACINDFFGLILKSVLLSRTIRKIVHYNAYLGVEKSITLLSKRNEIINFIRKNNEIQADYPEKFITRDFTKYFESQCFKRNEDADR